MSRREDETWKIIGAFVSARHIGRTVDHGAVIRLIHSGAAFAAEGLVNRCTFVVSRVRHQRRAKLSLRTIFLLRCVPVLNARHHTNLRGHGSALPGPTGARAL